MYCLQAIHICTASKQYIFVLPPGNTYSKKTIKTGANLGAFSMQWWDADPPILWEVFSSAECVMSSYIPKSHYSDIISVFNHRSGQICTNYCSVLAFKSEDVFASLVDSSSNFISDITIHCFWYIFSLSIIEMVLHLLNRLQAFPQYSFKKRILFYFCS